MTKYGADVDNDEDKLGRTALHAAVEAGSLEIVELLVDRKADIDRQEKQGRDCLAQAVREFELDILKYLVSLQRARKSDDGFLLRQDFAGDTPLHHAARYDNGKAADLLSNAGDP